MEARKDISAKVARLFPLVILLLTVGAFAAVLHNGFVNWDDDLNIIDNPNYRGLGRRELGWMFTTLFLGHYQPLSWATLGLDYLIWGMDPFGYHLTSLILHAANAVIFYFLAARLLALALSAGREDFAVRLGAAFAAVLFAVHPLRVESVAWATERRDVLSGLFFLAAIIYYIKAATAETESGYRKGMVAAVGIYILSLLAKAVGMSLPVILLVLDVYPLGRLEADPRKWFGEASRKVLREKVPFVLLAAAAAVLAAFAQTGAMKPVSEYGFAGRLAQAGYSFAFYIWKTIVPTGLSPLYETPPFFRPGDWIYVLSGLSVLAATIALVFFRRRWPAGLAVWIYYVALVLPVSGLVQSGPQFVADRYSYLSCLGFALLAGGGLALIYRRWLVITETAQALAAAVLVATVASLCYLTSRQAEIWHDTEGLWRAVIAVDPNSAIANNDLGNLLRKQGKLDEAVAHYHRVIKANPTYPAVYYNLGNVLSTQGKLDESVENYREAVQRLPTFTRAHYSLGLGLVLQGKQDEAYEHFEQAVRLDPRFFEAQNNLGLILASRGRWEEAIRHYQQALEVKPDFALAHVNLGEALAQRGKTGEAIGHFRRALEIEPQMAAARESLALALVRDGRLDEAVQEYERAIKKQPGFADLYSGLGNAYFKRGRYKDAADQYRRAVKIDPANAAAHYSLANAMSKAGDPGSAIEQYRLAIQYDGKNMEAYSNLGNALEARGQIDEAIEQYRRVVAARPEDAPAHYNLANALLRKEEFKGAVSEYQRALQINPKYVEARTNLGSALDADGKKDEAAAEYRKALEINPNYAAARFNLGLLLGERGNIAEATEQFRRVVEINPRDPEARYHLGNLWLAAGKPDEAAAEFMQALRIEPNFAPAREKLQRLLAPREVKSGQKPSPGGGDN